MKKAITAMTILAMAFVTANTAKAKDVEWGKKEVVAVKAAKAPIAKKPVRWSLGVGLSSHIFKIENGREMSSDPTMAITGMVQKPFGDNWIGVETTYVPKIYGQGRPWFVDNYQRGEKLEVNLFLCSGAVLVGRQWLGVGAAFNYLPDSSAKVEKRQHQIFLDKKSWGYVVAITFRIYGNLYFSGRFYQELGSFSGKPKRSGMELSSFTTGLQLGSY